VSVLAEYLIETSLQGESTIAARCAATVTAGVDRVTTIVLLRLRHQLAYQQQAAQATRCWPKSAWPWPSAAGKP
jgi:hypothetical protein